MQTKTSLSLGYPSEEPNCKISGPSLRQTAFEQFLRSSIGKNSVAGLAITKEIAPRGAACVKRLRASSPRSSAKRDSQRSAPFEDEAWSTGRILWASDSPQMKVPRPTWPLIKPSDSSSAYALATVVRWTPSCTASSRLAGVYQGAKLVAQLDVERNVAFGLQMHRNHWLSQPDQYNPVLCQVKSQFVFRQAEAATTRMTCRSCDLDCLFRQRYGLPADFGRTGTLYPEPLRGAACPRMLMLRRDRTGQARVPVLPKGGCGDDEWRAGGAYRGAVQWN